jgi:hypothetical protein
MSWSPNEIAEVAGLLRTFNGADEVCACMKCSPDELDDLSFDAFGCGFEQAKTVFAAIGRSELRQVLMGKALEGDMKALDMLARAYLGMGAVEVRAKHIAKQEEDGEDGSDDAFLAAVIANAASNSQ